MSSPRRSLALLGLAFLGFISLGLPDGLLGVAWPEMRADFALRPSALGPLLLAATCGYVASSAASGWILARIGVGTLLGASCLATAGSLLGYVASGAWPFVVASGVLAGLGAGAIDAGLNAWVARHHSARTVSWLHACYGVGAAAGPILMATLLASGHGWRSGYGLVAQAQMPTPARKVARADSRTWRHGPATRPTKPTNTLRDLVGATTLRGGAPALRRGAELRKLAPEGRSSVSTSLPWWHPERFAARRPFLEARARITAAVRGWLGSQGFVEVETPALQVSPGLEPHLHAFATELVAPPGPRDAARATRTLYLHTSPEFALKKLLVAGVPRLYALAHVFRNRERSSTHHPEFALLEWYRAGADYRALMDDCDALLRVAFEAAGRAAPPPAERVTVADAFAKHAGVDVLALAARGGADFDDAFFRIFLNEVEPRLGAGRPTLLYDWPIALGALARAKPGAPHLAERVELFLGGLELANGFSELVDAAEQRRRFARDVAEKARLYGERYPIDEDFLAALAHGMPASAGMALGFDRLVMCATGASRIEDVLWAPVAES